MYVSSLSLEISLSLYNSTLTLLIALTLLPAALTLRSHSPPYCSLAFLIALTLFLTLTLTLLIALTLLPAALALPFSLASFTLSCTPNDCTHSLPYSSYVSWRSHSHYRSHVPSLPLSLSFTALTLLTAPTFQICISNFMFDIIYA